MYESYYFGVIGPGFLNQVPTLPQKRLKVTYSATKWGFHSRKRVPRTDSLKGLLSTLTCHMGALAQMGAPIIGNP